MPKKRKLNSTNPKYWPDSAKVEPQIKEKKLVRNNNSPKFKVYAVFLENA